MKIPRRIEPLIDEGFVDAVVRSLKSGKEADVYVVRCGDDVRCAKVYKEAGQRSFRQQTQYREGRKVRNSRRARAMEKGTRYGRREQEQEWQSAEVDALYRLAEAGVRVPQPHGFISGVLLMELVTDADGRAAPRLNDLELSDEQAREYHGALLAQVTRMLCAGIVHGDLSEFNVLAGADGPVIIDLPPAVDGAANNSAFALLERDVANLAAYFGRFAPELRAGDHAEELWGLYQRGVLRPDSDLTGVVARSNAPADVDAVMREIEDVREDAARRRAAANGTDSEDYP